MTSSYCLKIVTDFASAHTLRDYPGACSRMHGHNWKVEVEVIATELDEIGMAIDFKAIKKATKQVTDELDHRYLNEIVPFDKINPTAENLSKFIYDSVKKKLPDSVMMSRVTVWESARYGATYSEQTRDQSQ